jgi:serine/threonine-protein kinase RsbW
LLKIAAVLLRISLVVIHLVIEIGFIVVIAIPLPRTKSNWTTISFSSTLYLCPILDLLLDQIPAEWQAEIRLGLQEALVNAAKHGNQLDPTKSVKVRFLEREEGYYWIIVDEGNGFVPSCECDQPPEEYLPEDDAENGRGLCLLYQIFDRVSWDCQGTQLKLCKQIKGKTPSIC